MEPVTVNKDTQRQTAQYAAFYAKQNGGREWTHEVDKVKQYPDMKQFKPANMSAFTIVTNLEIRKHS